MILFSVSALFSVRKKDLVFFKSHIGFPGTLPEANIAVWDTFLASSPDFQ